MIENVILEIDKFIAILNLNESFDSLEIKKELSLLKNLLLLNEIELQKMSKLLDIDLSKNGLINQSNELLTKLNIIFNYRK